MCWSAGRGLGGAERRWKGQVEDLRGHSSYQDAVGIDGEATELEWKFFRGFSKLTVRQEIQKDMHVKNSNHRTSSTRSSSCQCSMTFYGKHVMGIASRAQKESRITR